MPERLAAFDGVWPDKDRPEPMVTPEMSEAGRELAGTKGFNCISCHAFGDAPLAGTPGPDITAFGERLRYDWWRRYILAPERFKPKTRMTNFFEKGASSNTQVFGGDPAKQTDALWAYFSLGEFAPAPEGLPAAGGMELRVGSRPVILRAFLKSAGSRGIAVGFPAGTHFAFDAESCRLAEVWHGSFLDASGAWAGRGGMILKGQGPDAWVPPKGPAVVVGGRPETWPAEAGRQGGLHFKGYEIDKGGVPAFRYTLDTPGGPVPVTERFEPGAGAGTIRRSFAFTRLPTEVWINAGRGRSVTAKEPGGIKVEAVTTGQGDVWFRLTPEGVGGGPAVVSIDIIP
jgi:hypothetical protein